MMKDTISIVMCITHQKIGWQKECYFRGIKDIGCQWIGMNTFQSLCLL